MRLVVHTLLVLMLLGVLAGVVMHTRQTREWDEKQTLANAEVRRFQQQIHLQAALAQVERVEEGNPASIDPAWFQGNLPTNPFFGPEHPWLEVAGSSQKELRHPPDRTAVDENSATFWYNPYTGIVRARVPAGVSDAQALELYNAVNETALTSLFADW